MKVKVRLQLIGILPIIMALIIAALLSWKLFLLDDTVNRMRVADDLVQDVFRLNVATSRFAKNPSVENKEMWHEFHLRIGNALIKNKSLLEYKQYRLLMDDLKKIHEKIGEKFASVTLPEKKSKQQSEQMDALLTDVTTLSLQMMNIARTFAAGCHNSVVFILESTYSLGIGISSITAFLIALLSLFTGKKFSSDIEKLCDVMRKTAEGDLNAEVYAVDMNGSDNLLYLSLDARTIIRIRVDRAVYAPIGSQVNIRINPEGVRFFNAETEAAIMRENLR